MRRVVSFRCSPTVGRVRARALRADSGLAVLTSGCGRHLDNLPAQFSLGVTFTTSHSRQIVSSA